jgi:hypothetical protein
MPPSIVDGRARFGCSLAEFYQRHEIAQALARLGVMLKIPIEVDADAPPAYAYVNPLDPVESVARWIADCPRCRAGAAYVWLEGPLLMICVACGVTSPVVVPAERATIEALLLARPNSAQRAWMPGESLDRLRAENQLLGVG